MGEEKFTITVITDILRDVERFLNKFRMNY